MRTKFAELFLISIRYRCSNETLYQLWYKNLFT